MRRDRLERLGRTALPIVAVISFVVGLAATLAVAGDTLGYDYRAYHQAIERLAAGQPLYDMSISVAGTFGLFFYPPIFAVLLLPLASLPLDVAIAVWLATLLLAFLVGVLLLPVGRDVRWWIVLLAGLSFPFVYAVKLGQVGPILFLGFAAGWRWLDNPGRLGIAAAVGAAIKLQPGLILAWAFLTDRRTAAVFGGMTLTLLAVGATAVTGLPAWADFVTLLRTVTDPVTTPQNLTVGAVSYRLGLDRDVAALLQLASLIGVVAALLLAIRRCTGEASFLVAVIASQLVSPILWDHYAMLLLLPVAYLLSAGRWWAVGIPLVTSWLLVGVTPAVGYPLAFWVTLVAVLIVGRAERAASPRPVAPSGPNPAPAPS